MLGIVDMGTKYFAAGKQGNAIQGQLFPKPQ
jgi:hypothetical protein